MNILALLPKIYQPSQIYMGNKSKLFFKSIPDDSSVMLIISSGFQKQNSDYLEKIPIQFVEKLEMSGEPNPNSIEDLSTKCLEINPDYLLAVGGGSVIDTAKLIKQESTKLIVIPTTIGSGAEVSPHAVLNGEKHKNVSSGPQYLPHIVIYDQEAISSLASQQIISQSIDGLSHALEAIVSKAANSISDDHAMTALRIYFSILLSEQNFELTDRVVDLQRAGYHAGVAQGSAATGLIHALAHQLGPRLKVPHHTAISMALIPALEYQVQQTDAYKKMKPLENDYGSDMISLLRSILDMIDEPTSTIRISESADDLAGHIKKDVCMATNPIQPSIEDIKSILVKILK